MCKCITDVYLMLLRKKKIIEETVYLKIAGSSRRVILSC